VDNVIGELKIVNQRFPHVGLICIDDDAFFLRTDEEIEGFSHEYKKNISIPLWVTGAIPPAITEQKLAALTEAGMVALRMGVQSGSQRTKKANQYAHSNQAVLKAVRMIHGFRDKIKKPQFDIILDNPWEKEGGFRWTNRSCTFYLFPAGHETHLEVRGIIPDLKNYGRAEMVLEVRKEQRGIYKHCWRCAEPFHIKVPLPRRNRKWKSPLTFHLECSATFSPASMGTGNDNRELGVVLTYAALV
jgi:hypothetical protein